MSAGTDASALISPYGGHLVDLIVPEEARESIRARAGKLPSVQLSGRSVCDLELLAAGAFSPLDRFMGRGDYERVLGEMRLVDGQVSPLPVTLPAEPGAGVKLDTQIALRDAKNELLAVMTVEEAFEWDPEEAALRAFGTDDRRHPLVAEMRRWDRVNLSGRLQVFRLPTHYDFNDIRLTPAETRSRLQAFGHPNIVAFQTRVPLHRGHEELTRNAADEIDGVLLLHPVVGMTTPGDVDHYRRIKAHKALADGYYKRDRVLLSLLPLASRLAGPKEALWHAIISRNYGANHLIVGRDHASPAVGSNGDPFYGPYDAQELVESFSEEIGVGVVPFRESVYPPDDERHEEMSGVAPAATQPGTQVRAGSPSRSGSLPGRSTPPETHEILPETHPPPSRQGACVWFTGLSGSGKSTTAEFLTDLLMEHGRQVTVLDGDVVRTHLSKGLSFSKEDRDTNIRRIGFVAAEIVRHGGVVVCAAVSPYRAARDDAKNMVGADRFVEVFVDTPLDVCEERDAKGMYAQARRGEITGFTGIDDPYEPPEHPELTLNTVLHGPGTNAGLVRDYLLQKGLLEPAGPGLGDRP